jgi:hypothetical protein
MEAQTLLKRSSALRGNEDCLYAFGGGADIVNGGPAGIPIGPTARTR